MNPPPAPTVEAIADGDGPTMPPPTTRRESSSQQSENSQTAAEFIRDQMQLEQDAREALPFSIENCTKDLGPLRQSVFACLTCNPAPANPSEPHNPAGVCYACSVQCHGEHTLVEIFNKRNFTCDCGTTRFPATSPCSLRINSVTNTKGGVHSELPDFNNKYNQNFRNRFCGCECDYDPFQQKGTMFQCLGLGTHEDGGCGEDWWHPHCVVGLPPPTETETANKAAEKKLVNGTADLTPSDGALGTISEDETAAQVTDGATAAPENAEEDEEDELPPGFPAEDDFEAFLCYKCVEAYPWIKKYAGAPGFLLPVFHKEGGAVEASTDAQANGSSKKRKAEDDDLEQADSQDSKRIKSDTEADQKPATETEQNSTTSEAKPVKTEAQPENDTKPACKLLSLPPAPQGKFSLFLTESFRDNLCRCADCFPLLQPHAQLLEEEDTYEPPVSEQGSDDGGSTHGSGSLYERGESALRNVDRVRAIEGVMAYNHLKDQLKPFFQKFAESGEAISAEDIKAYFAKLRGDDAPAAEASEVAGDSRKEQSGY